jgi:hypothetical protein
VNPDRTEVRLSSPLPATVTAEAYEYCTKLSPLFVYKSTSQGYWPVTCTSASGTSAETAARYFSFGWFLAAAMINRTSFPISLCRELVVQLWPGTEPVGGSFVPTEFDLLAFDEIVHQVWHGCMRP